ncbi:MAG: hypothetical protein ABIQ99_17710 [Thermoflexales bacterium]
MSDQLASTLRDLLFEHLNDDELATLCGAVGLDYAQLPGEGKFGKTRELVRAATARDKLRLLAARTRDLRPEFTEILASAMPAPHAAAAPASSQPFAGLSLASLRRYLVPAVIGLAILLCVGAALASGLFAPPGPRTGVPTIAAPVSATVAPTVALPPAATAQGASAVAPTRQAALATAPTATVPASVGTPMPVPTTGVTPAAAITSTPETPIAPGSPDPARTVVELNTQLIEFYTGKLEGAALSQFWREGPRQSVLTFAESPLLKLLGLTAQARADSLSVQMKYVKDPAVTQKGDNRAIVESREYWRYANTKTSRVLCETRNYVYRMAFENGRYVVDTFQGELIDTRCAE